MVRHISRKYKKVNKRKSKKVSHRKHKKTHRRKHKGGEDDKGKTKRTRSKSTINEVPSTKKFKDDSPRTVTDIRSTNPSPVNVDTLNNMMTQLSLRPPTSRTLEKLEEENEIRERMRLDNEFREREAERKANERKAAIMKLRKEMEEQKRKENKNKENEKINWSKLTAKEKQEKRNELDFKKHKKEEEEIEREKERLVEKKILENYGKEMYLDPEEPSLGEPVYPFGQRTTKYADDYGEGITFGGKKKKSKYFFF